MTTVNMLEAKNSLMWRCGRLRPTRACRRLRGG
jgi:hypothetical protein